MEEITGLVEEIIFENEENGYKVCVFDTGDDYITVKGTMPYIVPGEYLVLQGKWENHREYGDQFHVLSYEKKLPATAADIENFLSSGLIEGVGAVTAQAIVKRFGTEALSVILNEPYKLEEIRGISHAKAMRINAAFAEHQQMSDLVMFLSRYGIGPAFAARIFKEYGTEALSVIEADPYRLCTDIPGIGFKTSDEIGNALDVPKNSQHRLCAGVFSLIAAGAQNGHVFIPRDILVSTAARYLLCKPEEIENAVDLLKNEGKIKLTEGEFGVHVYLWGTYNKELYISKKLKELAAFRYETDEKHFNDAMRQFVNYNGIQPDEKQEKAVRSAGENGFSIITGGPGTGKTTIIRCVLHYLGSIGIKCLLAAPTGRAAKRMAEACGVEAKTLHRLLEINAGTEEEGAEMSFKRNEMSPLDAGAVIVDESSMVDMILFYHLLCAVKPGTRLILVGDKDQLPSVGPGKVLRDCIDAGVFNTVILEEIYRQESESLIPYNARKINRGEMPDLNVKEKDFFLIRRRTPEECLAAVLELCGKRLPTAYRLDPLSDLQVIIPTKKGPCGVLNANNELQRILNPPMPYKHEIEAKGIVFREGDRVMQVKNDYDMEWRKGRGGTVTGTGIFNGEMGILARIDTKARSVFVVFDDEREAVYDYQKLANLELCYAVTVHKSQGSEFDYCIIPVFAGAPMLMTRNLLYTAVTRARKMVILVGSEENLNAMIRNNMEQLRYTGLKNMLEGEAAEDGISSD